MYDPSLASISSHYETFFAADKGGKHDDDDDKKKKKRKEIFKFIAAKVLAYHGLPKAYTAAKISQNSTFETGLKAEDGSYAGLHRRVRVEKTLVPPCELCAVRSQLRHKELTRMTSGQAQLLRPSARHRPQGPQWLFPHHQPPSHPSWINL